LEKTDVATPVLHCLTVIPRRLVHLKHDSKNASLSSSSPRNPFINASFSHFPTESITSNHPPCISLRSADGMGHVEWTQARRYVRRRKGACFERGAMREVVVVGPSSAPPTLMSFFRFVDCDAVLVVRDPSRRPSVRASGRPIASTPPSQTSFALRAPHGDRGQRRRRARR
jgi:hypothetical protein